jgi:hypothetical protein
MTDTGTDTGSLRDFARLRFNSCDFPLMIYDLSRCLGSFGPLSMAWEDGLGKLDVLGQPRTFAYQLLMSLCGRPNCPDVRHRNHYYLPTHRRGTARPSRAVGLPPPLP